MFQLLLSKHAIADCESTIITRYRYFPQVAPDRNSRYCRNVTACVTMTVKTRGRLQNVKRLIESARYLYPHIKVIIADELEPNATDSDYRSVDLPPSGVVYFKTTPGVGFGRRVALSLVVTKYALVMDDDFVFTSQTNLAKLVDLLERSSADIVGGAVIDYVLYAGITRVVDSCESAGTCYASQYNYPGAFYERVPLFGSCFVTDRVKNFFLADRQAVLAAGSWDESRPFYEHEDFFVQMRRSGVTVALCLDVKVIHRWRNHSRLAFIRGQYDRIMAQQFLLKWKLAAVYECRPQLYLAQNCYVPGSKPTSTPLDRNTAAALNQSRLAPICER